MDLAGSVQTSIFAYLLMAVVAMLAAVMVQGIVIVLERAQHRRKAGVAPTSVSISVAPAVDETAAARRRGGRRSLRDPGCAPLGAHR